MPVRYRVYGLTIECDFPLSCPRNSKDSAPDVRLKRATAERFDQVRTMATIPPRAAQWFECARLEDGSTYLRWARLFEFLVAPDGRTIVRIGSIAKAFAGQLLADLASEGKVRLADPAQPYYY